MDQFQPPFRTGPPGFSTWTTPSLNFKLCRYQARGREEEAHGEYSPGLDAGPGCVTRRRHSPHGADVPLRHRAGDDAPGCDRRNRRSVTVAPERQCRRVAAHQLYKIGVGATLNVARYLSRQPVPPVTFVRAVMITRADAAEVAGAFLPK